MSQFNIRTYSELLHQALDVGYQFINFEQTSDSSRINPSSANIVSTSGRCLLRHDVDADLAAALVMAQAEEKMGISATYFLMWRSPCYNLMGRSGQQYAEEIIGLGHQIGLHYDQGFDALRQTSSEATAQYVCQQADWMEKLLSCRISAVSFHQPSPALLQAGVDCGNRLNTYDRKRLRDFHYISDSNRVFPLWSEVSGNPADRAGSNALASRYPQDIQLLIHPMWWVYEENSTEAVWNNAIISNLLQTQKQLLETERAYGTSRRFSITQMKHDFKNEF